MGRPTKMQLRTTAANTLFMISGHHVENCFLSISFQRIMCGHVAAGRTQRRTCTDVSITQCFLHCLVNTHRQDTFLCVPLLSITAYFVNVLLGNTRIWETLKNVTPVYIQHLDLGFRPCQMINL
jgi:hypothetical protein